MLPEKDLELLQTYLDGGLAPEQMAGLEVRLRADAALADGLIRLAREETILKEWAGLHVAACEPVPATLPLSGHKHAGGRAWRRLAVVAASLLLVAVLLARPRGHELAALAQLEDVQGEVYVLTDAGEVEAQEGQKLFAGQGVSTAGEGSSAVVRYVDATRLELGGDTRVQLLPGQQGKKVEVAQGAGDVSSIPEGKRITVSTPHLKVLSVGGKFSFASDPDVGTRVESEKGSVQVTRKCDGKSVTVDSGQYAVATRAVDPMQPLSVPSTRWTVSDVTGAAHFVAFAKDGQTVILSAGKGQVRFCDVATGQADRVLDKHRRKLTALCLSFDGRFLATAAEDATIFLWNLASGKERQIGPGMKSKVLALALAPDGKTLVAGCEDKMLRFFDLETGEERVVLKGHRGRINALVFSPDGEFLVSAGGQDKQVPELLMWDPREGRERQMAELPGHEREVLALSFSPDSKLLASAGRDNMLRLWNPRTGKTVRTIRGRAGPIGALAFGPDGKTLASGSCDGNITLWNTDTGLEAVSFKGHKNCVQSLAFSPDGQLLVTGGTDKTIKLWELGRAIAGSE